ncbi:hypothetical protein [uncultured Flavobacterium sp.]|uniref:hypothetical protein n=1 Tax=uncultured Flavobacterium sp. TaxID=165435 RepID=UPI0025DD85CC|nr:hypothetical protein [uncultured Flavobacterium sp.]
MKTRTLIFFLFLFFFNNCYTQTLDKLPKKMIINELSDYIYRNSDYLPSNIYTLKEIRKNILLFGMFHYKTEENLINGLYGFSMPHSHARVYYLIIEGNKYKILDVSTRTNLDTSLKELLDFCERQKFCFEITIEYMNRITSAFYRINKNPYKGMDINCESGVKDTIGLP